MGEKGMCDRCDEQPTTTTVKTKTGGIMHLCDYCADQWNEDYADDDEKSGTTE
jgi:protein-arginine kinase activator protein McsA